MFKPGDTVTAQGEGPDGTDLRGVVVARHGYLRVQTEHRKRGAVTVTRDYPIEGWAWRLDAAGRDKP